MYASESNLQGHEEVMSETENSQVTKVQSVKGAASESTISISKFPTHDPEDDICGELNLEKMRNI